MTQTVHWTAVPYLLRTNAWWATFGLATLLALAANFVLYGQLTFSGSDTPIGPPDGGGFLRVTIPVILLFAVTSRCFSPVPALVANLALGAFVIWRCYDTYLVAQTFQARPWVPATWLYSLWWSAACSLAVTAVAWLSYRRQPIRTSI